MISNDSPVEVNLSTKIVWQIMYEVILKGLKSGEQVESGGKEGFFTLFSINVN